MACVQTATLTMAGREMVRSRAVAESEAVQLAMGTSPSELQSTRWQYHESGDWRVKLGAGSALSLRGAPQLAGVPEVQEQLRSKDESVRRLVAETLAASVPRENRDIEGSERTKKLLQSADWRLRRGAVDALRRRESPPAEYADDLATLFVSDPDPEVRQAARGALEHMDAEQTRPALLAALKAHSATAGDVQDGEDQPSSAVIAAEEFLLRSLNGDKELVLELLPTSQHVSTLLLEEQQQKEKAREEELRQQEMARQLQQEQSSLQQEQMQKLHLMPAATESLYACPSRPKPERPREHPRPSPRRGYGKQRRPQAHAEVLKAPEVEVKAPELTQEEFEVKEAATRLREVQALSSLGPDELLQRSQELLQLLKEPGVTATGVATHVRCSAVDLLGSLGPRAGPEHVEGLMAHLVSEESRVRQVVIRALGALGATQAASDVAPFLADRDPNVRREASRTLATLGPAASAAAVATQLRSSNHAARLAAQQAFLRMKPDSCREPTSPRRRTEAVLESILPHVEPLSKARPEDEEHEVRAAAVELIERLLRTAGGRAGSDADNKESDEVKTLQTEDTASYLDDPSWKVRAEAVRDLCTAGLSNPEVAAELATHLADSRAEVRGAAAHAFESFKSDCAASAAAPVAVGFLDHQSQSVRRAASWALKHMGEAGQAHEKQRCLALLTDSDASMRCKAMEELMEQFAETLSHEEVEAIAEHRYDSHWAVRLALVKGLAALHLEAGAHHSVLQLFAYDKDWRVRKKAANALARGE
eukprot:TRINITY_DN27618_c0_g1_i1.p1 TRINITY_DN27618_c0_g1~~TRINITY_DN27618_c0_g1_i1.p1  ORF type:complete len:766 (+),score=186.89 TRINITY_DN27618_c0_g1_i1:85-2382(+)